MGEPKKSGPATVPTKPLSALQRRMQKAEGREGEVTFTLNLTCTKNYSLGFAIGRSDTGKGAIVIKVGNTLKRICKENKFPMRPGQTHILYINNEPVQGKLYKDIVAQ